MSTDNPAQPPSRPASQPASAPPPPVKKGALRIVKWIVLSIVLLVVLALVIGFMKLNDIVRSTVEKQSTNSLNVQTQLKSASVSLFGGTVGLTDFEVGSPAGFKAPQMMSLGGVYVGVKLGELRGDPVRINQIQIKDPKLVIEMQGAAFNIKKFIDSLPAGEDPKPADNSKPMKLVINNLNVQGAQVIFRPDLQALSALPGIGQNLGGLKQEYVLSIPTLDMQNIGNADGNNNGAAIKEVVTLLVTDLASKAAQSDQLPPELRQVLSLNVNDITGMVKAKLGEQVNKQLGKITEDLSKKVGGDAGKALEGVLKNSPGDAAKDPGKAIEQGLGGLLGGKEKKKKTPATQAQ
jgi:hypothetical protein